MRSAARWFCALVAAQALFLLAWAGWLEVELARAPTVLLDVRPVDPSEILRGTYIWLAYTISDVPHAKFPDPNAMQYGETVCVELEQGGEFWSVASARAGSCPDRDPGEPGRIVLEGRYAGADDDSVRIDYGIDRYYVPEGMGTPRGKLTVRAAVTSWHRALIKEVYLDGSPYP